MAYEGGITISRYMLIRHIILIMGSYAMGKSRGVNFDLRVHNKDGMKLIAMRTCSAFMSKTS